MNIDEIARKSKEVQEMEEMLTALKDKDRGITVAVRGKTSFWATGKTSEELNKVLSEYFTKRIKEAKKEIQTEAAK